MGAAGHKTFNSLISGQPELGYGNGMHSVGVGGTARGRILRDFEGVSEKSGVLSNFIHMQEAHYI